MQDGSSVVEFGNLGDTSAPTIARYILVAAQIVNPHVTELPKDLASTRGLHFSRSGALPMWSFVLNNAGELLYFALSRHPPQFPDESQAFIRISLRHGVDKQL